MNYFRPLINTPWRQVNKLKLLDSNQATCASRLLGRTAESCLFWVWLPGKSTIWILKFTVGILTTPKSASVYAPTRRLTKTPKERNRDGSLRSRIILGRLICWNSTLRNWFISLSSWPPRVTCTSTIKELNYLDLSDPTWTHIWWDVQYASPADAISRGTGYGR